MANFVYDPAREAFLKGDLDWAVQDFKALLVRGYTPATSHQFQSDVTTAGGTIVATSSNLANKTTTNGVADADDITWSAVAAGAACNHIVIIRDSGVAATSEVVVCIDTATNLPVTPNGGDIDVAWDSGANKIFKL